MVKTQHKARVTVETPRLIRMSRGDKSYPAIIFRGDKPEKGDVLAVPLENGITYIGTVYDATEADGEVLVEFRNGLTPTTKP